MLTPTKARQVALKIFRENGVRGLYRGLPVTALRDCGYGAYFAAVSGLNYIWRLADPLVTLVPSRSMKPRVDTSQLLKWEVVLIITRQIYSPSSRLE